MTIRPHRGTLLVAVTAAVALAACAGDAAPAVGTSPQRTTGATAAASESPSAAFLESVDRTAAASRRSFVALVRLATPNGTVEVRLEGTRSGDDRTLAVTTDRGAVSYAVTAGRATVDRGDGPQPIELAEVPAAPALDALRDLQDRAFPQPGVAVGTIDAAAVLGGDAVPSGGVDVTVDYVAGGFVQGFRMAAADRSFSAAVTFRDVAD